MSTAVSTESLSNLVNEAQLYGWKHRVREIDEEIRTLTAEHAKLHRLIEMASELMREAGLLEAAGSSSSTHSRSITRTLGGLTPINDFPSAVALVVDRAEDGVTYDEIREALLCSPLGDKLRKSDKGFYHALARAKAKGLFVDYKGYTFTPVNLRTFQTKVAAGIKQDKSPTSSLGSPMMAALLETVALHEGITAKDAIDHIRAGSERHKLPPIKSEGSAFNAITRLKQRGEIEPFGYHERQLRIGANANEEIKRLARSSASLTMPKRSEALNGKPASASVSREVAPSLFENQSDSKI